MLADQAEPVGLDPGAIARWFRELNIPFVLPFRFRRLGIGQSNLTYLLSDAAGATWVLRRPPLGHLLDSAHDVLREGRIISALAGTVVPTPRIYGQTTAPELTDAPLLAMEYMDGYVLDRRSVAEALSVQQRRRIGLALPGILAQIHAVDLVDVGLEDLASHRPYAQRQLKRWAGQWERSRTRELPDLDELTQRLLAAVPSQTELTLVHGDFHLRNLVLARDSDTVIAVLDWELATLGEPLADVGSFLAYWVEPSDETADDLAVTVLDGFPGRAELAREYIEQTGRDPARLSYWHALGLWKLAIIAEGVYRRSLEEPSNKASAGTPTLPWIDAVLRLARLTASLAGI
jgi:aminoglycoside phosphotransferase (APT) family kinase protein